MTAPIRSLSTKPAFVHLKVHSAYSLLEGALPIQSLPKLAEAAGMPAIALTDTNNMFGVLEFSDKLAGAGIQPIAGLTLAIDMEDGRRDESARRPGFLGQRHMDGLIALYAMNATGYANLTKLASRAHLAIKETDPPHTTWTELSALAEGLILLTGGPDGPIDRLLVEDQIEAAQKRLAALGQLVPGRLYVELQRHGLAGEKKVEAQLIEAAYAMALPIVATNECYFATRDDFEAHDVLLCIADGAYVSDDNRRRVTPQHYFKSADEMAKLFADLPEACATTIEIAQRCAFRPKGRKPILPSFVATSPETTDADRLAAEAKELDRQARAGLEARLAVLPLAEGFTRADYEQRLAYEVDVISKMKFPGYFLIVADFIQWSKANGIPVGPGRGSGAGSLVAWALTITDLDPLRFGLLFERFLNPERVSMPDFDIDFCQDRREEVIRYVQKKYGADRVAQIITHGKLQARAVLRDVGRVLQMPYGQVDKLTKLVPNNPANPVSLAQAINGEPKLQEARDAEPVVARLMDISLKLEGLYRHASTHAAGMVIGDRPLEELVPMYRDPKSSFPITQFNWKLVEAAGLVKFDFLGLKTLTVLTKAVELIARGRGIAVDLAMLDIGGSDPKVLAAYQLLAKADTVGVFQLESTGMRQSLIRLKPDRFEDIIAMVALYRPGPMDNIPTYINRKHGEEPVDYMHPMLEGILRETYGVIIYQEQVMQIAQVLAGYSLGDADLLRRAMGKKDKAEMAKQQARFVEGALKNGVKQKDAVEIFELVDKFAGYGFNKSHAAAYALVSYQTAYLKANYREEFLAASMTLDMGNTDKLAMFAGEAKRFGIAVKPPSINASEVDFLAEPPTKAGERGAIRYSLAALRNIGAGAVESLVQTRSDGGRFADVSDFARRFDPKAMNKRALETLAAAGAFDEFEPNRATAFANAEQMIALSNRLAADEAAGTSDLFGGGGAPRVDVRAQKPWTAMERLNREFEAVGFFLSGHPLDEYQSVLTKLGTTTYADVEASAERGQIAARIAAIVVSVRIKKSAKGNTFAFAMFSDKTGQFEAVIFSEALTQARDILEPGTAVLLSLEGERDGETLKLRTQSVESLEAAASRIQRSLRITLDGRAVATPDRLASLRSLLRPGRQSEVRMRIEVAERGRAIELVLPGRYDVTASHRGEIATLPGVLDVEEV